MKLNQSFVLFCLGLLVALAEAGTLLRGSRPKNDKLETTGADAEKEAAFYGRYDRNNGSALHGEPTEGADAVRDLKAGRAGRAGRGPGGRGPVGRGRGGRGPVGRGPAGRGRGGRGPVGRGSVGRGYKAYGRGFGGYGYKGGYGGYGYKASAYRGPYAGPYSYGGYGYSPQVTRGRQYRGFKSF